MCPPFKDRLPSLSHAGAINVSKLRERRGGMLTAVAGTAATGPGKLLPLAQKAAASGRAVVQVASVLVLRAGCCQ